VRIENQAHDEFDPPIMVDDSRLTYIFARNERAFEVIRSFSYRDAVNSDPFLGFEPGEAKIARIESNEEFDAEFGGYYWRTTYEIQFRATIDTAQARVTVVDAHGNTLSKIPPWNVTVANVGFNQLVFDKSGNLTKIACYDSQGKQPSTPQRLGLGGQQLIPTAPRELCPFISFQVYSVIPFAPLGIT
jgi:hypothetical protein